MKYNIGMSLLRIAEVVPEGMLIFFSSYKLMQNYYFYWKNNKIISKIEKFKKVFVESQNKRYFNLNIKKYIKNHKRGAIYFAVCGAKLSEGMDFIDSMARCVVIIGL